VRLANGKWVTPDMVLGKSIPGAKVIYIPDTDFDESLVQVCCNADCIVSEAVFLDRDRELARRHKHLTAMEAAEIAKCVRARRLIINHISPRYDKNEILAEACNVFTQTIIPQDLETVEILRKSPEKLE